MIHKKISYILFATCIFFAQAFSTIIELPAITEVTKHVTDKNTLVIFDIDNTILQANEIRATDQWFSAMVTHAKSKGYSDTQAVNTVLIPFGEVLKKSTVKAVEPAVSDVIKNLQAKGNTIIALTSRSLPFVECTLKQFKSINIDLNKPPYNKKDISFFIKFPARFINGILFCSNNDKGETLQVLFKKLKIKTPSKIVYVDDKEKYLNQIQKFADEIKIPFVGIRYSFMDNEVKSFVLDEESKKLVPKLKMEPVIKKSISKTTEF